MLNLEPLAALAANEMAGHDPAAANQAENMITKSLAILAEQGLYAFGLFLASRKRKEDQTHAMQINAEARRLLKSTRLASEEQLRAPSVPDFYRSLSKPQGNETPAEALRRMLLTKQLLETTLTYGRYAAKALKTGNAT
ncbi:MAG: hypothetical protein KBD39_04880 [Sterolibacterium sp.]|nr:hypothetical protein [Sterolibacterium sp.]MBP9799435.1 hypothetical protein [Sterolibacterium sp.]